MTWLTWRQFRVQALSVYGMLTAVVVVLAITGPSLVDRTDFSDMQVLYGVGIVLVYVLPAIVGVFWGVPLVTRELETGTHSLIWNQTVTRRRWLATKLGVGVLAAMVAAGLLSLAVSWWASPMDALASKDTEGFMLARIAPALFGARGIAPVGYAAFVLVLGVAVGIVLRRTVTAMAVTLVLFAAVQLAFPSFVRPYLLPPTQEAIAITASNIRQINGNSEGLQALKVASPAGAWVLGNETVDSAGNVASPLPEAVQHCGRRDSAEGPPDRRTIIQCLTQLSGLGYHQNVVYQPDSRFWPLQWIETAIFLALAGLLTWFCFRRLRHLS
jgi:ABC-type transport system involved in multi-copper enzyme maturation permease subunit